VTLYFTTKQQCMQYRTQPPYSNFKSVDIQYPSRSPRFLEIGNSSTPGVRHLVRPHARDLRRVKLPSANRREHEFNVISVLSTNQVDVRRSVESFDNFCLELVSTMGLSEPTQAFDDQAYFQGWLRYWHATGNHPTIEVWENFPLHEICEERRCCCNCLTRLQQIYNGGTAGGFAHESLVQSPVLLRD
jgi:hypothetical protein